MQSIWKRINKNLFTYINSIDDLAFLNEELLKKPYVGVDTEFRRTTKNNMRLALLQINDGDEIYLVDALLLENPGDKVSFLFSDHVTKIFHSCKEDLEAIFSWTNKKMTKIFDTQIANSLLCNEYSISYQGLVEKTLGISLEKKETRSNWMRRPLSDAQLKYAALDVEYLIYLFDAQNNELIASKKLGWHDEDLKKLIDMTFTPELRTEDISRTLPKSDEVKILSKFDTIVQQIAEKEKINPTLFFSKRAQKDFLRKALLYGIDQASAELTDWRSMLIKDELVLLLK
tara:strand:- start:900 stop:1760 length:861 start_codon:yes stop_codon:yes gene_type:complete